MELFELELNKCAVFILEIRRRHQRTSPIFSRVCLSSPVALSLASMISTLFLEEKHGFKWKGRRVRSSQ